MLTGGDVRCTQTRVKSTSNFVRIDRQGLQVNGTFYVMPRVDLKTLEEIFRAKVFKMLKKEGKITDELINNLMSWRHSGFSVHNGVRIARDDEEGRDKRGQYIIRNTFSEEKLTYKGKT
ncbi:MAG: hypothetical protein GY774_33265, partial [Planctomycetes bacterium]|nr:hypothetical protein [Planctomycetota bacterium]